MSQPIGGYQSPFFRQTLLTGVYSKVKLARRGLDLASEQLAFLILGHAAMFRNIVLNLGRAVSACTCIQFALFVAPSVALVHQSEGYLPRFVCFARSSAKTPGV